LGYIILTQVKNMTEQDYKNIEDIKRIIKYLHQGKLDLSAWPDAIRLNESLIKLLAEHKEYEDHMRAHH